MAIDLSTLTLPEVRELLNQLQTRAIELEMGARDEEASRKIRLAAAINRLTTLLGPVEAGKPDQATILGVLAYGDTVIAQNTGTAVVLLVKGLKEVTETVLDLTKAVANN